MKQQLLNSSPSPMNDKIRSRKKSEYDHLHISYMVCIHSLILQTQKTFALTYLRYFTKAFIIIRSSQTSDKVLKNAEFWLSPNDRFSLVVIFFLF